MGQRAAQVVTERYRWDRIAAAAELAYLDILRPTLRALRASSAELGA
jgi:hypothetical protein